MHNKISKSLYIVIFIVFICFVFDAFTNTYIVLRENYEVRLLKGTGDCSKVGYGFHKKILNKFSEIDENIEVINFNNFPSSLGYVFDHKKKSFTGNIAGKYLILIGANNSELNKYNNSNYKLIFSEKNCFLYSK